MTSSSLLPPASPISCCPPPSSPPAGHDQQCRRCSFLFNNSSESSLMANLLLGALSNAAGKQQQTTADIANASHKSSSSSNNQFPSRRRHSPPLLMSASSSPFIRLLTPLFSNSEPGSGQHSRGENSLELEALTAVHQFAVAVQSIAVSEMLPRTQDLIFVNLTTLDGQPYCLELTTKGWRITSLRTDCMQGDFTRMELFTQYYESLHDMMDVISPGFREKFADDFGRRFDLLNNGIIPHNYRHNYNDCSSGPISDYSEGEDSMSSTTNNTSCTRCRKRPSSGMGYEDERREGQEPNDVESKKKGPTSSKTSEQGSLKEGEENGDGVHREN